MIERHDFLDAHKRRHGLDPARTTLHGMERRIKAIGASDQGYRIRMSLVIHRARRAERERGRAGGGRAARTRRGDGSTGRPTISPL